MRDAVEEKMQEMRDLGKEGCWKGGRQKGSETGKDEFLAATWHCDSNTCKSVLLNPPWLRWAIESVDTRDVNILLFLNKLFIFFFTQTKNLSIRYVFKIKKSYQE